MTARRTFTASTACVLLLAGACGSDTPDLTTESGGEPIPLGLNSAAGGSPNAESAMAEDADRSAMPMWAPYEYVFSGDFPDLGTSAPVYRATPAALTAEEVQGWATALGITGTVTSTDQTSFSVSGDAGTVEAWRNSGAWDVWFSPYTAMSVDGDPGSSGSGSSGSSDGSDSTDSSVGVDPDTGVSSPPVEIQPGEVVEGDGVDGEAVEDEGVQGEVTIVESEPFDTVGDELPVVDLPSDEEAETIARELLDEMGVLTEEVEVSIEDGAMMGVATACAVDTECPTPSEETVVLSKTVVFETMVDGMTVEGLAWRVDIGDQGAVDGLYGSLTNLELVADYPLATVEDVFGDLQSGDGYFGGPMPLGADIAMSSRMTESGEKVEVDSEEFVGDPIPVTDEPVKPICWTDENGEEKCCAPVENGEEICVVEILPVEDVESLPVEEYVDPQPGEEIESMPPESIGDDIIIEEPYVEPEPIVVTITEVEIGRSLFYGMDATGEHAYVVPTYVFSGTTSDGSEYETYLPAVVDEYLTGPDTPAVEPAVEDPAIGEDPTGGGQPPSVGEDGVDPANDPIETVEDPPTLAPDEPTATVVVPDPDTPSSDVITTVGGPTTSVLASD